MTQQQPQGQALWEFVLLGVQTEELQKTTMNQSEERVE
jgi:hypothetical protein